MTKALRDRHQVTFSDKVVHPHRLPPTVLHVPMPISLHYPQGEELPTIAAKRQIAVGILNEGDSSADALRPICEPECPEISLSLAKQTLVCAFAPSSSR